MKWFAQAPANIALIKYMGKRDQERNIPANASFSYTLNHLLSFVELEAADIAADRWEQLEHPDALPLVLSESSQARFLAHLAFLKQTFSYTGSFIVRSANNFPADCGLASSASSFAALTICATSAFTKLTPGIDKPLPINEIAALSRHGSGSSCRSLLSPWVLWQQDSIEKVDCPQRDLFHWIIMSDAEKKSISSSEAHRLVETSPLYADRPARAEKRLELLLAALQQDNWVQAYEIVWQEFEDMHTLFETAATPFRYQTDASRFALQHIREYWQQVGDGPLVTMDAGSAIHLLFKPCQLALAVELLEPLRERYRIVGQ